MGTHGARSNTRRATCDTGRHGIVDGVAARLPAGEHHWAPPRSAILARRPLKRDPGRSSRRGRRPRAKCSGLRFVAGRVQILEAGSDETHVVCKALLARAAPRSHYCGFCRHQQAGPMQIPGTSIGRGARVTDEPRKGHARVGSGSVYGAAPPQRIPVRDRETTDSRDAGHGGHAMRTAKYGQFTANFRMAYLIPRPCC